MKIPATFSERIRVITSGLIALVMVSLLVDYANPPAFSRTVYEDSTILVRLDSPLFQEEVSETPVGTFLH